MAASAGMQVFYKNNTPYRIVIQNKDLEDDKIYRLITLNFISDGGDHILSDVNFENKEYSMVVFRDFLIDEVKKMTKEGKSVSDGFAQ